jgi:hypothetical protein
MGPEQYKAIVPANRRRNILFFYWESRARLNRRRPAHHSITACRPGLSRRVCFSWPHEYNHRGTDIGMPQEFLNRANIVSILYQRKYSDEPTDMSDSSVHHFRLIRREILISAM